MLVLVGHHIDPSAQPSSFHLVESGDCGTVGLGQRASDAIDRSLSRIKICRSESEALETKLRDEYFSQWDESCDVGEFHGFSKERLDDLLHKINARFEETGNDLKSKLQGIRWVSEWTYKVYEFQFGKVIDSGTVYFGMIALGKEKSSGMESFDAVTCLYKLEYTVAKVKVEKRKPKRTLGVRTGTSRRDWWESKNLDFVTQKALTNFCRMKAVDEFRRKGLASSVNNVQSIEDTD